MHIKSIFFTAVLGLGVVGAFPALAQRDVAIDMGEKAFVAFCGNCHGESGMGSGSLEGLLTVEVPDLTHLSANNHGEFPMLKVIHIIDGRSGTRVHEGPMPTFGETFDSGRYGPYGAEAVIRGHMLSMALYLESIQQ